MEPELHGLAPSYARVSLAIVTSGREANLLGNIHGGEIMKLADSTAGAVAARLRRETGRASCRERVSVVV